MKKGICIVIYFLFLSSLYSQYYTDPIKLKLDSLFANNKQSEPGGCIYVQMGNQIIYYKNFGTSNLQTKETFNDFTLVNIGGVSKTFIAYGILILQQEGKLNIEDSIFKYIPDIKNKEFAKKIRIRHLLTHTSGLKDLPSQKTDSVYNLSLRDPENFELVKYSNTLTFDPGSNFQYSDQAFSALVLILEKVSGKSWQDFVKEKIFDPAGMTLTKTTGKPGEKTNATHAYTKVKGVYSENDEGEIPKMYTAVNGGIWSNVVDLRKYLYALQYCLFLKCNAVDLSKQFLVPNNWYSPQPIPHTHCWFYNQIPGLENSTLTYEGQAGGYRTFLAIVPASEMSIVIVTNNGLSYTKEIIEGLKQFNYIK